VHFRACVATPSIDLFDASVAHLCATATAFGARLPIAPRGDLAMDWATTFAADAVLVSDVARFATICGMDVDVP